MLYPSLTRLMCLCDSPTVQTGFARVSMNLLKRWKPHFPKGIDVYAMNYGGWPHALQSEYRLYPPPPEWNGIEGLSAFCRLLEAAKADGNPFSHIWIMQDPSQLSAFDFPVALKQAADKLGIVVSFYFPVDSPIHPKWTGLINSVDIAVAYTQYGAAEAVKAGVVRKLHVLPHGVDTSVYYPISDEDRTAFRNAVFQGSIKPADFVMLNVNANQRRKGHVQSFQVLKALRMSGINAKLVMHMPELNTQEGTSLQMVSEQLGISDQDWACTDALFHLGHARGSETWLNNMYNACDLVLSTTLGEGWGFCLHPQTPIRTPDGFCDIGEIKPGDKVLTSDGFRPVLNTCQRHHSGELVEIVADKRPSSLPMRLTADHLVRATDGWKRACDIKVGDELLVAADGFEPYCAWVNQQIDLATQFNALDVCRTEGAIWFEGSRNKSLRRRVKINKDFAELYGIYLSEGSASKGGIVFSISRDETALTSRIRTLVRKVWGLGVAVEDCGKSKKRWVRVYSKLLRAFYAFNCGTGARNKSVRIFSRLTKHTAAKVFKGVWLGDGSEEAHGYEITTCSRTMALQLCAMADRLGFVLSLERNIRRDSYRMRVANGSARMFANILGLQKFSRHPIPKRKNRVIVKSVGVTPYVGEVCDIQVEGVHDFMTHHCIVHNSLIEGIAAGRRVAAPANTSCLEIANTINTLMPNAVIPLPLSGTAIVNMLDNSRVRYPVDHEKAAVRINANCPSYYRDPLVMNPGIRNWLDWDRIATEWLKLMDGVKKSPVADTVELAVP